ncbi:MAG: hypothetical protein EB121_05780 [Alphaproteobacteria bacterium]|nr:hypothetical protein [Alphaproteobacteria bacterium]
MAIEKGMPITVLQAEGVHLPWMCRAWGTLEDQGQFLIRNYGALGDILRLVSEDVLPKEAQRLEAAVRRFSGAASDGPSPNSPVGCQPGAQQGAPPPQPRLY